MIQEEMEEKEVMEMDQEEDREEGAGARENAESDALEAKIQENTHHHQTR